MANPYIAAKGAALGAPQKLMQGQAAQNPAPNIGNMRQQFFQSRREEAQRGVQSQGQEAQDAIQRRFASMGASGSGAQIAAMQKAREGVAEAGRLATRDVDQAELQALMAQQESEAGREFAREGMTQQQKMFDVEQQNKLKQLDLAEKQFLLDKDVTEFNKRMAEIEAGRPAPKGLLGDGLGAIGLDKGDIAMTGLNMTVGAPVAAAKAATKAVSSIFGGGK